MKVVLMLLTMALLNNLCKAQYNPRPTKSRFYNSKQSTFQVKPGDKLVYTYHDVDGSEKELTVTIDKFGDGLKYSYQTNGITKNMVVNTNAFTNATTYNFDFANDNAINQNHNLWLSKKTWRDLASKDKTTLMNFGAGAETFVRNDASTIKINYKGEEKIITVYNISNTSAGGGKNFTVLTDEKNPLITSINLGWTMTLKEVR